VTFAPLLPRTAGLAHLLVEAGLDVLLQLAQRGRLQRLEVDLDLVGVGVPQGGLPRLDDAHHAAQLAPRQAVDVEAQLPLLVVRHGQRLVVRVVVPHALPGETGRATGRTREFERR